MLELVLALTLATEIKPQTPEFLGEDVVALIKKQNREVMVDVVKGETYWTDSAILERNKKFPKSVAAMLKTPSPDRKLEAGKVAALLDAYQQHRDGYVEATIERTGPECFVVAGTTRALVNCLYVEYLHARYLKAKWLVHGALEPVLLVEGNRVHALLVPMKK